MIDLRVFSNSGIGCQALHDVPAGFTVLSVVICALAVESHEVVHIRA